MFRTVLSTSLLCSVAVLAAQQSFTPAAPVAAQTVQPKRTWPPAPDAIINLSSQNIPGGAPTIPAQSTYTVYTVPANKWLVITNLELGSSTNRLEEHRTDGAMVYKYGSTPAVTFGAAGLVFTPGSEVVIRNSYTSPSSGYFNIMGYLTN